MSTEISHTPVLNIRIPQPLLSKHPNLLSLGSLPMELNMKDKNYSSLFSTPSEKENPKNFMHFHNNENLDIQPNVMHHYKNSTSNKWPKNIYGSQQILPREKGKNSECDTKIDSDNDSKFNDYSRDNEDRDDLGLFCEEELGDGALDSSSKVETKKVIDNSKYKTEMCKNWLTMGYCNYGKKCKFAHGNNELEKKQVSFLPLG